MVGEAAEAMTDAIMIGIGVMANKELVKCDGWSADLGCNQVCRPSEWPGEYGGRQLCPQCAQRLIDDGKAWAWLTR